MKLTVLSGLSGAGKSTTARRIAFETGAEIISRDSLRHYFPALSELDLMFKTLQLAKSFLQIGTSVVVDEWNLEEIDYQRWVKLSRDLQVSLDWVHLSTPVEICVARDAKRPSPCGELMLVSAAQENASQIKFLETSFGSN